MKVNLNKILYKQFNWLCNTNQNFESKYLYNMNNMNNFIDYFQSYRKSTFMKKENMIKGLAPKINGKFLDFLIN